MEWRVLIGDEFDPEFLALPREVQDETLAMARLLQHLASSGTSACRHP